MIRVVAVAVASIAIGFGVLGYVWHGAAEKRGDQLALIQHQECERLNRVIRDYNAQYGVILTALVAVARAHPNEPTANAVVSAFQSPGFPLVKPAHCP